MRHKFAGLQVGDVAIAKAQLGFGLAGAIQNPNLCAVHTAKFLGGPVAQFKASFCWNQRRVGHGRERNRLGSNVSRAIKLTPLESTGK